MREGLIKGHTVSDGGELHPKLSSSPKSTLLIFTFCPSLNAYYGVCVCVYVYLYVHLCPGLSVIVCCVCQDAFIISTHGTH